MKLTEICHSTLKTIIKPNFLVVDATCGNGHDSLFLLQYLNHTGKLLGFDIQEQAIQNTDKLLKEHGFNNYQLLHKSHTELLNTLENQKVDLIMFNLGYLPGGDKSITSNSESTVLALNQSIEALKTRGTLSLMIYPGHTKGQVEAEAIEQWLEDSNRLLRIIKIEITNAIRKAPYIIIAEKLGSSPKSMGRRRLNSSTTSNKNK